MPKSNRKLLFILVPVLSLGLIWIAVHFAQNYLVQKTLASLNKQFDGQLTLEGSHITTFANFSKISIDLENIKFYESKDISASPLYEAEDFYIGFNLWDLFTGVFKIEEMKIRNGHLDIIHYENGDLNILLAKGVDQSESDSTSSDFNFDIKDLEIENFTLRYEERVSKRDIIAKINLVQSGISFSADHFFIDLKGDLVLDIDQNKENTFFADKAISLDIELDFDQTTQLLQITPSRLALQASEFEVSGSIDLDDEFDTDLKIEGQKPNFDIFAAFAPKEVADALNGYQNEGDIFFLGKIKGKASNGHTPAISVDFGCESAWFVNTDIDKRIDDLRFTGYFTNGASRSLETSEIQLKNFYFKPEKGDFEGTFFIKNFNDPFVNVDLHADLDLEFVSDFFNLSILEDLSGNVTVDMHLSELSDLRTLDYDSDHLRKDVDSEITVTDLSFKLPQHPIPITALNMRAELRSGAIALDTLYFKLGSSDFHIKGVIDDFTALFHGQKSPVNATLSAASENIILKDILAFDPSLADSTSEEITDFSVVIAFNSTGDQLSTFDYLPKGEFFITSLYGKLNHYQHTLHDFHADVLIDETDLQLIDFSGEIDETDFHFSGKVENFTKWFQPVKKGDSKFEFDLVSNFLHPKDLLTYKGTNYLPEEYRDEEFRDLKLHGQLTLHYDSLMQSADFVLTELSSRMKLHPLKLEKFAGRAHYENEHLLVEDFSGVMGESDFNINLTWYAGQDSLLQKTDNSFELTSSKLDLDALMNYSLKKTSDRAHAEAFNIFQIPFSELNFSATVDQLNYHTYWLEDFSIAGRMTADHFIYLDQFEVHAAEGQLSIEGYFNGSDPDQIYFSSQMKAEKLDLDRLMVKFENFGQDYLINENLHGKVSGTINSKFLVYPDLTPILDKSTAEIDLTVYEGSLVNFTPFQALSGYFDDKNLNVVRFDTLKNTLSLERGILNIPSMNINSSLGFMEISGKQTLDMSMDYFLRIPLSLVTQAGIQSLFGKKNQAEIAVDQQDSIIYRNTDKRVRFVNINVSGTPDDFKVGLGKEKN